MDQSAPLALALCGHVYSWPDTYVISTQATLTQFSKSSMRQSSSLIFLTQGDQNFRFLLLSEVIQVLQILQVILFCIPLQHADYNFFL